MVRPYIYKPCPSMYTSIDTVYSYNQEDNISTVAADSQKVSHSATALTRELNSNQLNSQLQKKPIFFVSAKEARICHSATTRIGNIQTLIFDNFTSLHFLRTNSISRSNR